jgi:CRP-like cAMP-binding protein
LEQLRKTIENIYKLSEESMTTFLSVWREWLVAGDKQILREHAVADYIYFLNKGMARIFYYKNGKEITEWIAPEGTMCLSLTSFFNRTPSKLVIHTIGPAHVYGVHHNDLEALAASHHEIETLYRKMLAASLILSQQRMESIQFETAEQRYKKLIKQNPDFLLKVPLSYIASFLGVTLETLSRIRSAFH